MDGGQLNEKEKMIKYPKQFMLADALRRNALRLPNKLALAFQDKKYTYKELNSRVNRLANALINLGIKKGGKVALLGYNSTEWVESMFAVAKAGGVAIPMNFRLAGPEIEYIVNHCEAVVLVVDYSLLDSIEDVKDNFKSVKEIIVARGKAPKGMLEYDEVLASGLDNEPQVDVWEGDLGALVQTSGTTGKPKGVLHSHRSITTIFSQIAFIHGYKETDRGLLCLPAYSSAGAAYDIGGTLYSGGALYMLPIPPFDPLEILKTIDREKINHTTMAPVMLQFILALPEDVRSQYDMSSLHALLSVGGPTSPETREAAIKYFGEILYIEYSASEHGVSTLLRPEEVLKKPTSSGIPALDCEVKVVDSEGNEVPRGEKGEIVVASSMVCEGYFKDPEATKAMFYGRFGGIGDIGYQDEEGHIYLVDRKSDMIISGGTNVYPAGIEEVMIKHPKIAEVAIIGVPSKKWGEEVKAVVRLKPGEEASEEEIITWCRGKIAGYEIPKSVDFVSDFPRTATGKVRKVEVREKYWAGYEQRIH